MEKTTRTLYWTLLTMSALLMALALGSLEAYFRAIGAACDPTWVSHICSTNDVQVANHLNAFALTAALSLLILVGAYITRRRQGSQPTTLGEEPLLLHAHETTKSAETTLLNK